MFNFAGRAKEAELPTVEPQLAECEAKLVDALAVNEKFHEVSVELTTIKQELAETKAELATLKQMVDAMPVNVMTLNLEDFTVDYINQTSLKTLVTIEHLLPVKADQVLGQCIDIFHKNPEHQRRLLKDARNLPHTANIQIGWIDFIT